MNYVNINILWPQSIAKIIVTVLVVEDGEKSQIRISTTPLQDIYIKIYHFEASKHNQGSSKEMTVQ